MDKIQMIPITEDSTLSFFVEVEEGMMPYIYFKGEKLLMQLVKADELDISHYYHIYKEILLKLNLNAHFVNEFKLVKLNQFNTYELTNVKSYLRSNDKVEKKLEEVKNKASLSVTHNEQIALFIQEELNKEEKKLQEKEQALSQLMNKV